ncbi:DUF4873 domain-containing protein [Pseudonocardia sp. CA-107938]|uniref:DUF4873 domain-containing protein n=1 Tax=Pseudonocardia sp. CA-107938 TaxID=3240021 RepID=UPI003D8FD261
MAEDGWSGPATLVVDGREIAVHALLDARHEPVDGRLHWFGRLRPDGGDIPTADGPVELRTKEGSAQGRLGEADPWGRHRITGVGAPPYRWALVGGSALEVPVVLAGSSDTAGTGARPIVAAGDADAAGLVGGRVGNGDRSEPGHEERPGNSSESSGPDG